MNIHWPRKQFNTPAWLKRMGMAGFLFFFFKGMLWLSLPLIIRLLLG